jgi:hypothetical protein
MMKGLNKKQVIFIVFCFSFIACHHPQKQISFYYWRTVYDLDTAEKQALKYNEVNVLHLRYFDVDFSPEDSVPGPVAPIVFTPAPVEYTLIPVIYIRNRTFERIHADSLENLARSVFTLVSAINRSKNIHPDEIQFDCDWTETTKNKYFGFIRQYRALARQLVSATIRLHQVKYAGTTGIPPVDYGVLMFYNMGDINAGPGNSVYERSVTEKYSPAIKRYPLPLDLALPVFTWGLQIRDGRVIQLLNKMGSAHFKNDSNFTKIRENRYAVRHACFHGGYYFREDDAVKIEQVPEKDLFEMVEQVNAYSNHKIRNLVFYDLDQRNLALYDKNIFREIRDHTD